jgi:uncharacterized protein YqeY
MISEAQMQEDLKVAMKARDMERVYVLRGLITAIKAVKVDKMVQELDEAEIAGLVRKEINKRTEAGEYARKADRMSDVEANLREIAVLEHYLPSQLDAAQLEAAIRQIAAEAGTTEIGPIMAQLKARFAGQYDGKLASQIVKTRLAG